MIKAILIDIDGVLFFGKSRLLSERLLEDYGIEPQKVVSFFKDEFQLCKIGGLDLKSVLKEKLPLWGWKQSTNKFLDYWFKHDFEINDALISLLKQLQEKNIFVYVVSNNEKYRSDYLINIFNKYIRFDGYFFSYEIGFTKCDTGFFIEVLQKINLDPTEVVFIDDKDKNIFTASKVGIKSLLFNQEKCIKYLQKL